MRITKSKVLIGLILLSAVIFGWAWYWTEYNVTNVQTLESGINVNYGSSEYDFVKEPPSAGKFDYLKAYPGLSKLNCYEGECMIEYDVCNLDNLEENKRELNYYVTDVSQKEDKSNRIKNIRYEVLNNTDIIEVPYSCNCIKENKTEDKIICEECIKEIKEDNYIDSA